MSILINGMNMPENCTDCNLMADGWCYATEAWDHKYDDLNSERRPDWCPLVEVPTPREMRTRVSGSISRREAIDALCDNCDHVDAVCPHYPCKQYTAIEKLLPIDVIELGVEYDAKAYTIMISTNYIGRKDGSLNTWLEKKQTFKVEKK